MRTHHWYMIGLAIVALMVVGGLWSNIGNGSLSETHAATEKIHMLPGVNKASDPITTGSNLH
jgi:hypothetical protein